MQAATASRTTAEKWTIAGTVVLGAFVSVMDISIVNVAMPQMISTFGVSLDAITWVAVAYSISEIILVTMSAWFSRLLGRKNFFVLSFMVFTAASVLCGLARSLEMMIFARILQGIGGGGLIPVAQAIMLETFPEEERGMAMAIYSMGITVAGVVGPVLGGLLTDTYGWPWIFLHQCAHWHTGHNPVHRGARRSAPYAARAWCVLMSWALSCWPWGSRRCNWCWSGAERENWFDSSFIVWMTVLTLITLTALVLWELFTEEPVINLRLLKNVPFTSGSVLGFLFGITLYGSTFILPLFLQRLAGLFRIRFRHLATASHADHSGRDPNRRPAVQLYG